MIRSYRRVSTDEQHNGPQAQMDAINHWLDAQYPKSWPREDYIDIGVSGSVPLFERPEGGKLGDAIEQDCTKEGPIVVVAKLDRLFRSVADAATTIAHWDKVGIKLVSVSEGFDMTNPYGRAMCQMASVFAELEREMIRSRTKAALQSKKARGECVGEVPYGWNNVDGKLVYNEKEQATIRYIIQHHEEFGESAKLIAASLNLDGVRAKKGGKWHPTQVNRIIQSELIRKDCEV